LVTVERDGVMSHHYLQTVPLLLNSCPLKTTFAHRAHYGHGPAADKDNTRRYHCPRVYAVIGYEKRTPN